MSKQGENQYRENFAEVLKILHHEISRHRATGAPLSRDVAAFIERHLSDAISEQPSRLIKSPLESEQIPTMHMANAFSLLASIFQDSKYEGVHLLRAITLADQWKVQPPDWAFSALVEACVRVYKTNGKTSLNDVLRVTPGKLTAGTTENRNELMGGIFAEASDGDLSRDEATELTNFEAEYVFGFEPLATDTLQKYSRKLQPENREGMMSVFLLSLVGCNHEHLKPAHYIFDKPWRRLVLKRRLEAYREATSATLSNATIISEVTQKTDDALWENRPANFNIYPDGKANAFANKIIRGPSEPLKEAPHG